ncbi:hypothetical protein VTL71DRAFT_100 [Oculimacula yallundae]|uniref:Heterokaryon incompatibility domain-containing protein n=1 Tax=Oculimacula yallundae TaxID=86028 RepID=A0ABR4D0L7_9HELO
MGPGKFVGVSPLGPIPRETQKIVRLGMNREASGSKAMSSALTGLKKKAEVRYKPLDFDTFEIRLLRLNWDDLGPSTDGIDCSLEYVSLIDPGPYIALSYCWGSLEDTKTIHVDSVEFKATTNLVSALKAIRKLKRKTGDGAFTRLWVDAVCINQNDPQERSQQVRTMRQIYSKAQEVLAFAGHCNVEKGTLPMGMSRAQTLSRLKIIHGTSDWDKKPASHNTLHEIQLPSPKIQAIETRELLDFADYARFFGEPYWNRAWVIQEITVGPQVTVLYGDIEFLWEDIVAFFSLLKKSERAQQFPQFQFSQGIDHLLEFRERYYVNDTLMSLFEALNLSRRALATDPRDKIFALLGLCHDGSTFVPVPNYRQPLESIIADMSKAMMTRKKSLDAICLRGISFNQSIRSLPTWAPNWERIWKGGTTLQEDNLLMTQKVGSFNPIMGGSTGLLLNVRGTRIGSVTHLTSAMKPHSRDDEPLPVRAPWILKTGSLAAEIPALGSASPDVSRFLQIIWKTLTMGLPIKDTIEPQSELCFSTLWMPHGRGSIHDLNLIEWIDRNAFFVIGKWTLREWSQTKRLARLSKTSVDNISKIEHFVNVLGRVLGSGMRLACLDTRQYFIGMVHPDAQVGDLIYNLRGCSVPVILRKTSDPFGPTNHYEVIGSAYLDESLGVDAVLANMPTENITLR